MNLEPAGIAPAAPIQAVVLNIAFTTSTEAPGLGNGVKTEGAKLDLAERVIQWPSEPSPIVRNGRLAGSGANLAVRWFPQNLLASV
jgi:hypothetical protein